ncbi:unnamed protein product [Prunus brigantina]
MVWISLRLGGQKSSALTKPKAIRMSVDIVISEGNNLFRRQHFIPKATFNPKATILSLGTFVPIGSTYFNNYALQGSRFRSIQDSDSRSVESYDTRNTRYNIREFEFDPTVRSYRTRKSHNRRNLFEAQTVYELESEHTYAPMKTRGSLRDIMPHNYTTHAPAARGGCPKNLKI